MKQKGGRLLASEDALPISQNGVCCTVSHPTAHCLRHWQSHKRYKTFILAVRRYKSFILAAPRFGPEALGPAPGAGCISHSGAARGRPRQRYSLMASNSFATQKLPKKGAF